MTNWPAAPHPSPRLLILRLPDSTPFLSTLSPAERMVAEAIAQGLSNAEIAKARGTSSRTIANQIAALFQRTAVQSRAELVRSLFGGVLPT